MKRIRLAAIAVAALTVFSICGCSSQSSSAPTTSKADVVEDVVEDVEEDVVADVVEDVTEEVPADVADVTEEAEESNADHPSQLYTVEITWFNSADGEEHLEMYVDLDGKMIDQEAEEAYDDNGMLVYTKTEEYMDANNNVKVIDYLIYSFDSDLEIRVEPKGGDNTTDLQGVIVDISNDMTGECYNYTFEDLGTRGQTGVWYVTAFMLKDGEFQVVE